MSALLGAFSAASAAQWQQYVTPGSYPTVDGCDDHPSGAAVPVTEAECTDATEAVYDTVPFPFVKANGDPWDTDDSYQGGASSSWTSVPPGCSFSTKSFRGLFNTNTGGVGDTDRYFLICKLPLPPSPPTRRPAS